VDYAGYHTLRFDRRGRILTVTIDRPEALNAVNAAMHEDLAAFLRIAPEAKKIVFGLLDLEKPIICRLNGAAAGLGASIALLCDIIVAADTARIGDPHVRMGLVAGDGGAVIWPQLVGFAKAKELLIMDASVAYEMMSNVSADHQEAVSAFREKRPPRFTGR
jgi:enoyl-CoA hydratase